MGVRGGYAQTIADSFLYRHEKLSVIEFTPIRYVKLGIGLRIKVRGLFLVDCAAYSASLYRHPTRIIRQNGREITRFHIVVVQLCKNSKI